MTSEFATGRVGAHDHRHRVPANDRGDPGLHLDVAAKRALLFGRNGVLIGAEGRHVGDDAEILGLPVKRRQNEFGPLASRHTKDRLERVEPLGGLGRIAIACPPWAVERRGRIESLEHAATPLPLDRAARSVDDQFAHLISGWARHARSGSPFRSDQSDAEIGRLQQSTFCRT
jgi:hypothetical protein